MIRMKGRFAACWMIAASVLWMSNVASANLIQGGGFEGGNYNLPVGVSPGNNAIPHWTVTGTNSVIWNLIPFADASHGDFYLDLTGSSQPGNAGVTQSIATNVGATYSISFDLANYKTSGLNNEARVLIDGVAHDFNLGSVDPSYSTPSSPNYNHFEWHHEAFNFVATAATTNITISVLPDPGNNSSSFLGLDNVAVEFVSAAPIVPEPSSLALAGIGLIGLAFRSRKRTVVSAA